MINASQLSVSHEGDPLVASAEEIQQRVYETADEILNWWGLTKDANRLFLAGLATAALPFVADLSRAMWKMDHARYVNFDLQPIVKGNRHVRPQSQVATWLRNIHWPTTHPNKEVVLAVDTILDTGETLIEAFEQFRPRPVGSVVLFCKSREALNLVVKETGCPVLYAWQTWETLPHWLYGYGTDAGDHSSRGCPAMRAVTSQGTFVDRGLGGIEKP